MPANRKEIDIKIFFRELPRFYSFAACDAVERAWRLADDRYRNCVSRDGRPFVYDLRRIASFLVYDHANDVTIVVSGLLNSILEDTDTTEEEIRDAFGDEVLCVLHEIREIRLLANKGLPPSEMLEGMKKKDRRAAWVFLAEQYVRAAALSPFIPVQVWEEDRAMDRAVWIPLADHFSLQVLADSFRLLRPELPLGGMIRPVPEIPALPAESADACGHFHLAEELFRKGIVDEAEKEYDRAAQLCPPDDATLRIYALEGLARCIRRRDREDIHAVLIYREILALVNENHRNDPEKYWLEVCAISDSLGRACMATGMYPDAKEALLDAVSACEQYVGFTGLPSFDMIGHTYFSLGVLYSLDNQSLGESEAAMMRARNARQALYRQDPGEENLLNLREVLTALIDLSAWRNKPAEEYESELEAVEKRLAMLERNRPDCSTGRKPDREGKE